MPELEPHYFDEDNDEESERTPLQLVDDAESLFGFENENEEVKESELNKVQLSDDPIKDYLRNAGKRPLLNAAQEVELSQSIEAGLFAKERIALLLGQGAVKKSLEIKDLNELARIGEKATDAMINANLRLVVSIGKRYTNRGLSVLDIYQEGNIGLIRAVRKFDYTKGYKFSTYATWWIRQSITRAIADTSSEIRIPVHMHEKINQLKRIEQTADRNGHFASDEDVAEQMDMSIEDIKNLREYSRQRRPFSYNTPLGDDKVSEFSDLIQDGDAIDPEDAAAQNDLVKVMKKVVDMLNEKEARIISLRFGLDGNEPMTLDAIGEIEGLTRERIRQIEIQAKTKLKTLLLHSGNMDFHEYFS